ncbi:MAG: hypothetical protein KC501_35200 [Myxococcales bacterium]|nr:hypothetical protein [Myxococcales bacterium]
MIDRRQPRALLRLVLERVAGPGVVLALAAGCSFVLDPERLDDVPRCRYDDDCPPADDPRYTLVCTVSEDFEDQELDFPRICSPRPAVSCNPREYPFDSPFATRYREATALDERYADPCSSTPGVQGCGPGDQGCAPGLSPHEISHRCDDLDPDTPPAVATDPLVTGQDVLDQLCRSVYCHIAFACETEDFRCVPCELGAPLGRGGCGDLYFTGVRSTVYQSADALIDECGGPEMDPEDAYLGPVGGDDIDIHE